MLSGVFGTAVSVAQTNQINPKSQEDVLYCVDPYWEPYEAIKNGIHVGISAQYLQVIAELSGLSFTLVPLSFECDSRPFVFCVCAH